MKAVGPAGAFYVYLLGAFRLEQNSRTIHLPTRKDESLLAYLCLFPEPHPREQLAALLWGESTDEQARHSLRTTLAAIRKILGKEILLADRETVQLVPMRVDALEFQDLAVPQSPIERLRSAIALYRGDLLADFYDDWVARERERLRTLYVDSLLRLVERYREQSEYATASEILQQVLATEPANERAHQHLMFCLAAQGDRISALKQYDQCKKVLHEELNVEPSAETTALHDRIMSQLLGAPARQAELTNLPNPLTSFVGRDRELAQLRGLWGISRLITLTGAGGCGKTRLAIELAREALPHLPHGVWWVDLSTVSDPASVATTAARVLGVRESPGQPPTEMLTLFIRDKPLLVVLDNCEQIIDACSELAESLLLACPHLKILATSREALSVTGELIFRVSPLALPEPDSRPLLEQLLTYDSIVLFSQRARAVAPGWKLEDDATAVLRICARLDGIPLAIELAAAHVQRLSVRDIALRLDDRFQVLTGAARGSLPRHRSICATLDWSYDLLSEKERVLFRRLAVFQGSWNLRAAEDICSDANLAPREVMVWLLRLVDKSLVVISEQGGETRYRYLETIHDYAHERLLESGEEQVLGNRHLETFVRLSEELGPKVRSPQSRACVDRVGIERENLRAAMAWAVEHEPEFGVRLAWPIREVDFFMSQSPDVLEWSTRLVLRTETAKSPETRVRALLFAGWIALVQGNRRCAQQLLQRAVALARTEGSKHDLAWGLLYLGHSLTTPGDLGDYQAARLDLEESLELSRELGDQGGVARALSRLGMWANSCGEQNIAQGFYESSLATLEEVGDTMLSSYVLNGLGEMARSRGENEKASRYYQDSLHLDQMRGDKWSSSVLLSNWGWATLALGNLSLASALFQQSATLFRDAGELDGESLCLAGLAGVIGMKGTPQCAARLFGATEAEFERVSYEWAPVDRRDYERTVAAVRARADPEAFERAWAEGRTLSHDEAVAEALEHVK